MTKMTLLEQQPPYAQLPALLRVTSGNARRRPGPLRAFPRNRGTQRNSLCWRRPPRNTNLTETLSPHTCLGELYHCVHLSPPTKANKMWNTMCWQDDTRTSAEVQPPRTTKDRSQQPACRGEVWQPDQAKGLCQNKRNKS